MSPMLFHLHPHLSFCLLPCSIIVIFFTITISLKIFTLVRRITGRLDIKSAFRGHFKIGARRIGHPRIGPINLDRQEATNDRHAFGGIGSKAMTAITDDSDTEFATVAGRCQALDLVVKIGTVLNGHDY